MRIYTWMVPSWTSTAAPLRTTFSISPPFTLTSTEMSFFLPISTPCSNKYFHSPSPLLFASQHANALQALPVPASSMKEIILVRYFCLPLSSFPVDVKYFVPINPPLLSAPMYNSGLKHFSVRLPFPSSPALPSTSMLGNSTRMKFMPGRR